MKEITVITKWNARNSTKGPEKTVPLCPQVTEETAGTPDGIPPSKVNTYTGMDSGAPDHSGQGS